MRKHSNIAAPRAELNVSRMQFTRSFFKYYDALEQLNSAKEALAVLLSRSMPLNDEQDVYGIRRILDYKQELESAQKDISIFGELTNKYAGELMQSLKNAGVRPGNMISITIAKDNALDVWYTEDGRCHYKGLRN